jgi:hypothetical protein
MEVLSTHSHNLLHMYLHWIEQYRHGEDSWQATCHTCSLWMWNRIKSLTVETHMPVVPLIGLSEFPAGKALAPLHQTRHSCSSPSGSAQLNPVLYSLLRTP